MVTPVRALPSSWSVTATSLAAAVPKFFTVTFIRSVFPAAWIPAVGTSDVMARFGRICSTQLIRCTSAPEALDVTGEDEDTYSGLKVDIGLPAFLRSHARVSAGSVDEGDHRTAELLSLIHEAKGLAITFWMG